MAEEVKLEDTIRGTFGTTKATTGAAQNDDGTPTCVVLEQGTAMGYAPTCTNKATGLYEVAIVCSAANGFEVGKEYSSYVVVLVDGVTRRGPVPGVSSFIIRARSADDLAYPQTTGRGTLVAADGSVSPNWADVKSPTTTLALTGTTVGTATTVTGGATSAALTTAQTDLTTLVARVTAAVATATSLATAQTDLTTLISRVTAAVATASALTTAQTDLTTLIARVTAAVATASALATAQSAISALPSAATIATAVADKAIDGVKTVRGVLTRMDAFVKGKATGLGGATAAFYAADGTTKVIEATQDVDLGTREAASTAAGD